MINRKNELLDKIEWVSISVWQGTLSDTSDKGSHARCLIWKIEKLRQEYQIFSRDFGDMCDNASSKIGDLRKACTLDIEESGNADRKADHNEKVRKISSLISDLRETPKKEI